MVQDRLKALRSEMAKRGISLYVVPTADFHESEYAGEHFKARKYITGFTGSAGTAVITMDEAVKPVIYLRALKCSPTYSDS